MAFLAAKFLKTFFIITST